MPSTTATVTTGDMAFHINCWSASHFSTKLKAIVLAGTMREIRLALESLSENSTFAINGETYFTDGDYRVIASKIMMKDYAVISVRSLDPKCLWTTEPKELFDALMHTPYETPLLYRWMLLFRAAMDHRGLVVKLKGYQPQGEILSPELTPGMLDKLASKGVSERKLRLQ
jgi:hypothetical protein